MSQVEGQLHRASQDPPEEHVRQGDVDPGRAARRSGGTSASAAEPAAGDPMELEARARPRARREVARARGGRPRPRSTSRASSASTRRRRTCRRRRCPTATRSTCRRCSSSASGVGSTSEARRLIAAGRRQARRRGRHGARRPARRGSRALRSRRESAVSCASAPPETCYHPRAVHTDGVRKSLQLETIWRPSGEAGYDIPTPTLKPLRDESEAFLRRSKSSAGL